MRNLHRRVDRYYIGQIYGVDFAKGGLLAEESKWEDFSNLIFHHENQKGAKIVPKNIFNLRICMRCNPK